MTLRFHSPGNRMSVFSAYLFLSPLNRRAARFSRADVHWEKSKRIVASVDRPRRRADRINKWDQPDVQSRARVK